MVDGWELTLVSVRKLLKLVYFLVIDCPPFTPRDSRAGVRGGVGAGRARGALLVMDAPVVAAALAEMARGDAHAARARNAPRNANLASGPSPAPPSRAGVSAPRDARGRDPDRALSHWHLLTGVRVGVLFTNAVHSTSSSGAVLGSASASETVSDARASNPFAASVWRDVVAGSFGKAFERASPVAGETPMSATELPRSVLAYGAGFRDKLGRSLLRTLDASSFAFGGDEKIKSLAEWRRSSSSSRDEIASSSSKNRRVAFLGLAM